MIQERWRSREQSHFHWLESVQERVLDMKIRNLYELVRDKITAFRAALKLRLLKDGIPTDIRS
jgi:hypothetical protein